MAAAILGRFDDRTGVTWRDPQARERVDTSDPDVVSLETLLSDPPDPSVVVARGLAFAGCTMGFIRGPKASGKTTILAAAAARVSVKGEPWADREHRGRDGVGRDCNDDPRSWVLGAYATLERTLRAS